MLKFIVAFSLCSFLMTAANAELPETIDILYVKAPFNLQFGPGSFSDEFLFAGFGKC